jgi:SAM-dependent methyltransferase
MHKACVYEYEPFIAEYYDFIPLYANRADLAFYLHWARRAGGAILELGCGTGRILIPTAVALAEVEGAPRFPIVGLDLSEPMLAKCRQKLARQAKAVQQRVRLVHGRMTDFDLGEVFSLVTAPFRCFQHLLRVEDQLATLHCVHRHLRMGGKFILDVFQVLPQALLDPEWTKEREDTPTVELPDGRKLRRTNRVIAFHRAEQYNEIEMIYYVTHPDGRTERLLQVFSFHYFFRYEVEHLLERCGFRLVELFGNYDGSPLSNDSPEMIFVAEKYENLTDEPRPPEAGAGN